MSLKGDMLLLQQGAEAKVFRSDFAGRPSIVKVRFSKKYRHPALDQKLTQKRVVQEARSLLRCRKIGILAPSVYFVDLENNTLVIEDITDSITLKEYIFQQKQDYSGTSPYPENLENVMRQIGKGLSLLHDADIIHGDLTTSNLLIRKKISSGESGLEIYFIDFGLSTSSRLPEDKGVDLYVLEKAFLSTHPNSEKLFEALIGAYKKQSKNSSPVLSKYNEIKLRGRKRTMVG